MANEILQAPPAAPPQTPPVAPGFVPSEGPQIPWKAIALYGGAGLLIVAVVFGLFFLVFRRKAPAGELPSERPSGEAPVVSSAAARRAFEEAKAACANAEDYDACAADAALRGATRGEVVELCGEITDERTRDQCVLEVALRRGDERLCVRASESVAAYCVGVFQSERAKREGDMELCLAVSDAIQRESCFAAIIATKDRAFCETLPEGLHERCIVTMIYRDAAGNPALCNELADPAERETCVRDVASESAVPTADSDNDGLSDDEEAQRGTNSEKADTDGDGLSDGEEVTRWQTDPKNADTDGDGFGDGTEVRAGYNPKGGGRL